jgi:hypothetical protein
MVNDPENCCEINLVISAGNENYDKWSTSCEDQGVKKRPNIKSQIPNSKKVLWLGA